MATPAAAGQVVNIGDDSSETRIEDLATLVLRLAGVTPRLERLPAPAGSVARRCPDIARLRELTGFAPKMSLEAGVADTFAWYRDHWATERGAERPGRAR
jgi:UDP-glucuronate decarboxylase